MNNKILSVRRFQHTFAVSAVRQGINRQASDRRRDRVEPDFQSRCAAFQSAVIHGCERQIRAVIFRIRFIQAECAFELSGACAFLIRFSCQRDIVRRCQRLRYGFTGFLICESLLFRHTGHSTAAPAVLRLGKDQITNADLFDRSKILISIDLVQRFLIIVRFCQLAAVLIIADTEAEIKAVFI